MPLSTYVQGLRVRAGLAGVVSTQRMRSGGSHDTWRVGSIAQAVVNRLTSDTCAHTAFKENLLRTKDYKWI
jgi:hypothetical protein